ncbi:type I-U CRISPR-associated protein Csb2 [Gammaproteobacteria bacterium AB-CW1]|uniref:Type I-U CRISPR-associated protein Csb2 n=1 Tax=Natronospira elongata TaxID=3110268 RepID=A0AAP6MM57_9GAMM|nr:type I-U CRISPR-associated protein Csb2 [Gammaproteobacteria bacterium AB-CW1]
MLTLGIRYLNGFSAAAAPDDMERAEWPPHPGRVFMALAAAHFQTGADQTERQALLWLEGADRGGEITAPAVAASEATQRAIVKHYVPVNDRAGPAKALLHSLPLTRARQERVFARAWLEEDTAYLLWRDLEPPPHYREALAKLCAKVTRIGHSTSLVQMWVAEAAEAGEPNWVPDDNRAIEDLRIAGPGTLEYLERQYNTPAVEDYANLKAQEMEAESPKIKREIRKQLSEDFENQPPPQQRPTLPLRQGYAPPLPDQAPAIVGTVFTPHLLTVQLKPESSTYKALDLTSTLNVINRMREAILSHSNDLSAPVRRLLSGHSVKGGPSDQPHLAFLPQAFVGSKHADGHLMGLGLALPADISRTDRREALRAIAGVRDLKLGPLGCWHIEPIIASRPPWNLRPNAWTAYERGARHWSTVTPIVFDRHPKTKDRTQYQEEVAQMITRACNRIDLPKPKDIIATHISAHPGVPPAFQFPRIKRKDGSERRHVHAILIFDEPVCGPILLGAGRFRGYGACRPL